MTSQDWKGRAESVGSAYYSFNLVLSQVIATLRLF